MANNGSSFFAELKRRNVYRVGIAYVVVGWLALQALDIVVPIMHAPEWFSQLVLVLLVIGLPFALIFAWAFEMTPEGLKREKDVDRSTSITHETGQTLNRIIIGVLVVAVVGLLIDRLVLNGSSTEPGIDAKVPPSDTFEVTATTTPSIAVLPFANMSADEGSAYFSDGLADTLLHMLAQIREIRVAARTSSFQFRDQNTNITEIAKSLNVKTILEGSVQRAGNKIRVTAQLIEADTGFHLWSGNYDRDMDDIFGIQDEIATEVVAALKVSLLGESAERLTQRDTDNLDAYDAYLKAQSEFADNFYESLRRAEGHLQDAIQLDPNYALAHSKLAQTYMAMNGTGIIAESEMIKKGRPAATRALELDPQLSEARALLGWFEYSDGNEDNAAELLLRAITTGANDIVAMSVYVNYLMREARPSEALQLSRTIADLDPLSVASQVNLIISLISNGRFDEASEVIARVEELEPGSGVFFSAVNEWLKGNWANGATAMSRSSAIDPDDPEGPWISGLAYLSIEMPEAATLEFQNAANIDPDHAVSRAAPLVLDSYQGRVTEQTYQNARQQLVDDVDERHGSKLHVLDVFVNYAAKNQKLDDAISVFEILYPTLFEDEPRDIEDNLDGAFYVGKVEVLRGNTERGTDLLREFVTISKKHDDAYGTTINSVAASALLGDKDGALRKLENLKNDWDVLTAVWTLGIRDNEDFTSLRNEPAFIARLADFSRRAAEQRAILEEMNRDTK
ncbi:MAG: hypothetical protein E4H42_04950 [Chromatiales bacterium]|nr:MAG: hypothetical protein E4H42_04950 [Chromatiales bacterium]